MDDKVTPQKNNKLNDPESPPQGSISSQKPEIEDQNPVTTSQDNAEDKQKDSKPHPGLKSKLKSRRLIFTVFLIFLIILALLFILSISGGGGDNEEISEVPTVTNTPTPEPFVSPPPELIPETENEETEFKEFKSDKLINLEFSGFILTYPATWLIQNQRLDSVPSSRVVLQKDRHQLIIEQGNFEERVCIYDNQAPPSDTPYIDFRSYIYKDVETLFGSLRRTEDKDNSKSIYTYCQEERVFSRSTFHESTDIGKITIQGPVNINSEILNQMEEVIINLELI